MSILKRFLAALIVLCMAASLIACSEDEDETVSATDESVTESEEDTDASDDTGVTDLPYFNAEPYIDAETGYFKGVKALDIVTLADYKNITVPYDVYAMTDEALQDNIDYILNQNTTEVHVTDRAVADGDTVHIVYTGSVDGEEFAGGTTGDSGTDVTIGVTSYIDDFLEQLIGHMPGETVNVEVTFPDPYPNNPSLANKDALFVTEIKYISETVTPELTDSFVQRNYSSQGWKTVDELKEGIREAHKNTYSRNYVADYLLDNCKVSEIPEIASAYNKDYFEWTVKLSCANSNYDVDTYVKMQGYESLEDYYTASKETLDTSIKSDLIFQAIAEEMQLVPTADDVKSFLIDFYGEANYENYIKTFEATMSPESMLHSVISSIITTKLLDTATFAEKE